MNFKDKFKNIDIYFHLEDKLESKNFELEEAEKKLKLKNLELEEVEKQIKIKKSELESLKIESVELKDYINSKFIEEFQEYDYGVDITNCYIISLNGKMYITLKTHTTDRSNFTSIATGSYNVEIYKYYDVLNVKNNKYRYLCCYKYGHFDRDGYFPPKFIGKQPDYEKHILEVYPELSVFCGNKIPNTYLKKIYYEANELGTKRLIKKLLNK